MLLEFKMVSAFRAAATFQLSPSLFDDVPAILLETFPHVSLHLFCFHLPLLMLLQYFYVYRLTDRESRLHTVLDHFVRVMVTTTWNSESLLS